MRAELVVTDPIQFHSDPSAHAYVRWAEVFLRPGAHQHLLNSGSCRNPDRYVSVFMMIVRKHSKHLLSHKECGLSVRKLLGGVGKSTANASDPLQLAATVRLTVTRILIRHLVPFCLEILANLQIELKSVKM